jgi:hypothetical protein
VLGVELTFGSRGRSNPSIDRFNNDPAVGYIKSNVNIISYRANGLKSDATAEEMRYVLAYMEGGPALSQALRFGTSSLDCVTLTLAQVGTK